MFLLSCGWVSCSELKFVGQKSENIFPVMLSKISPKVLLCELAGEGVSGNIFRIGWEFSEHLQEGAGVLKVFAKVEECGKEHLQEWVRMGR